MSSRTDPSRQGASRTTLLVTVAGALLAAACAPTPSPSMLFASADPAVPPMPADMLSAANGKADPPFQIAALLTYAEQQRQTAPRPTAQRPTAAAAPINLAQAKPPAKAAASPSTTAVSPAQTAQMAYAAPAKAAVTRVKAVAPRAAGTVRGHALARGVKVAAAPRPSLIRIDAVAVQPATLQPVSRLAAPREASRPHPRALAQSEPLPSISRIGAIVQHWLSTLRV